ncbi:hypothetical protein BP00DRAFT_451863 [Aspergillus indologenus CBS 114.80]|uniref:Uncharacterized protein n=1 Tax=Aspergillus indologenus CBS 114.80 TaxID=1450541 RepID=A0A2V5HSM6_9EURO|nr:hypothetical protein BP00DRAFT_451863 [Aspergillus indologenus CBS 114.80]
MNAGPGHIRGTSSFLNQSALDADIARYEKFFGLPAENITPELLQRAGDDQNGTTASYIEANLDAELIVALSGPLPTVEFITGGSPPISLSDETHEYYARYTNFSGRGFPDVSAHSMYPEDGLFCDLLRTSAAWHDIKVGPAIGCNGVNPQTNRRVPGASVIPWAHWNATTGWDPVTGLGTPDLAQRKALVLSIGHQHSLLRDWWRRSIIMKQFSGLISESERNKGREDSMHC